MGKFNPTESQRAAMEARGSAVLVSAGAGSGKTMVLTERLMGYICSDSDPKDLDSFLIITFTRAAAAELRARISAEIAARLAADPGNRRLRRQSALAQKAQIGTIHSFCAALLRENCHLLALSPDFKIADDERVSTMKAAALERVMEQRYQSPDSYPGFLALADTVGAGRDDRRLTELVLSLYERMQCHARPADWANEQIAKLKAPASDAAETEWGREIMDSAMQSAEYWKGEFDELIYRHIAPDEKLSRAYLESFSQTAGQLRELCRSLSVGWDKARECLPIEFPRIGRAPASELTEMLKARREACKRDMGRLAASFNESSERLLRDLSESAGAMEALLQVTLDFDRAFTLDKRKRALVDYSDLEHLTAQLLTNPDGTPSDFARHYSQRYTEIMVDEFQDVSRVQDAIFRAVSKDGSNLFMVGDVKQSIYRFRLADPEIFTEKLEQWPDYTAAETGEARRILLRENFRSRREIINCANSVFETCMSRALGGIDYDESAALICGASYYEGEVEKPELLLLNLESGGEEETPDRTELEAKLVAEKIESLFAQNTQASGRPLEYGDIAILLRSANSIGGIYSRVLSERGIPVASAQGSGFFTAVEVSAVVSLLAVIDNPHQDIPLIAVLRSPCFGFSADELSEIRGADKDGDFYSALCASKSEKCSAFITKLNSFRAVAPDLSAAELTWQLINELDLLPICSAMSEGEQRRANLMELIELSERFEGTGYRGVHRFVLWLRKLAEKGQEVSVGPAQSSAVQIMSIHRSKGLEFPVVFLCDTSRRFNRQDSRETVLVHPVLGLGPKYTDLKLRLEYPTLARNAIKLRMEREMLSEEMRLLYVALTRPKERLFMTAAVKNAEKKVHDLAAAVSEPLSPSVLNRAGSMLDWLITAALVDERSHAEPERNLKLTICETPEDAAAKAESELEPEADAEALRELERRLSFRYEHETAVALPSKVTATELKGRESADEDAEQLAPRKPHTLRMPDFTRKDRPITGTEKGIATHLVLQCMDFSKASSRAAIVSELERLRENRFLSQREADAVDIRAIEKLFKADIGRRMLKADELHREFKFSILSPAEQLFPGAEGESLLLQGVIDCFIREGEELTIIDYKTDRVFTDGDISDRAALYRGQLRAYAEALEKICGRRVKQCVLFFLAAGTEITI